MSVRPMVQTALEAGGPIRRHLVQWLVDEFDELQRKANDTQRCPRCHALGGHPCTDGERERDESGYPVPDAHVPQGESRSIRLPHGYVIISALMPNHFSVLVYDSPGDNPVASILINKRGE